MGRLIFNHNVPMSVYLPRLTCEHVNRWYSTYFYVIHVFPSYLNISSMWQGSHSLFRSLLPLPQINDKSRYFFSAWTLQNSNYFLGQLPVPPNIWVGYSHLTSPPPTHTSYLNYQSTTIIIFHFILFLQSTFNLHILKGHPNLRHTANFVNKNER